MNDEDVDYTKKNLAIYLPFSYVVVSACIYQLFKLIFFLCECVCEKKWNEKLD